MRSSAARARAFLERVDRRLYVWLSLTVAAGTITATLLPVPYPLNMFEAYAAYALLPMWPSLLYAMWRGLGAHAAACALCCLVHLGWTGDFLVRPISAGAASSGDGTALRLVVSNLLAPEGSPALARELRDAEADVLVLSELSTEWSRILGQEHVYDAFPHARAEVIPAEVSYFGIGIFSRHPIVDHGMARIDGVPLAWADLDVAGSITRLYAVHLFPPTSSDGLSRWRRQLDVLSARIEDDVAADRRLVVAGDLNTTAMTHAYRRLLGLGLTSAHEAAGRPFATTWPNGLWPFPPVRIDHVLVRGVGVRAVREGEGLGTDHLPIIADLVVQ